MCVFMMLMSWQDGNRDRNDGDEHDASEFWEAPKKKGASLRSVTREDFDR